MIRLGIRLCPEAPLDALLAALRTLNPLPHPAPWPIPPFQRGYTQVDAAQGPELLFVEWVWDRSTRALRGKLWPLALYYGV